MTDAEPLMAAAEFLHWWQARLDAADAVDFPGLERRVLSLDTGRRYLRIICAREPGRQRSAYGFIDLHSGDLLMAASWAAPAKHARGSVYDRATWEGATGNYGMAYLR